jgi:integrase
MDQFAEHIAAHRLAGCFLLTLLGLRREETGGLRWCDVDLTDGTLTISQARVDVNGRDLIEPPKTDRSFRTLPIPARELAALKAMRKRHIEERMRVGQQLAPTDLLMSRPDGTWLPVRDYSRLFDVERKAAGLPRISLRNVRHSSVSRMRERGSAPTSWRAGTGTMSR